ncbi:MAG: flagellar basal body-associated FliL family protein [Paracoccus sp. (in: a-proteobacteria)]|uniref:flagellar basal body-associated FliL family protein n=1 Tax=Paracoccus sp. TaxID=267 RepID=UPI0026DF0335|nr:flagellar basal body-associated FliL family protein [Paracoccus sp. (in: a-proteobacteria)]MDO5621668.1 flagellar basal body-associated FliL family protein [Paracoccus sp. (in: a-proteobacteria)]
MIEDTISDEGQPRSRRGKLMLVGATILALAAGFGSVFAGIWAPSALLKNQIQTTQAQPQPEFVAVPDIAISLPGDPIRYLLLKASLQVPKGRAAEVQKKMPRLSDSFNLFLSNIDPAAFQRRGILEIVRAELLTRGRFVLGAENLEDVLVTEFRLQ